MPRQGKLLALGAALLLVYGAYLGLFVAPRDAAMGEVYRIMFVHVPAAWVAMLGFATNFGASIYYLARRTARADALAAAAAEVGLVFTVLLLITGSLWGKPTWGVYWTFDPRLSTAAVMGLAYAGYLALRKLIDDTSRRATWSAAAAILAFVDLPLVWLSVKWWSGLHQAQTEQGSLHPSMYRALAVNVLAFGVAAAWLVYARYKLARRAQRRELVPEEET